MPPQNGKIKFKKFGPLDMGMDPFNFADALLGIFAQKPISWRRRRSSSCLPSIAGPGGLDGWRQDGQCRGRSSASGMARGSNARDGTFTLYRVKGCPAYDGSGYKGRVGLRELLIGSDLLKKQVREHARVAELFATALKCPLRWAASRKSCRVSLIPRTVAN